MLFLTLFLVSVFSFVLVFIFQTKSIQSKNIQNQYLYIQANNHKEFLLSYIKTLNLEKINKLEIQDDIFFIKANIKKIKEKFNIDIFIKAKDYDISLHQKLIL